MVSTTPLSGIHVVEMGQNIAAPFAASILADLGATVLKIENPGGDDARHYGAKVGEDSAIGFEIVNRNKDSLSLDLSDEDNREWLRSYIADNADVCIQSLRPGKAAEMGLGEDDLIKRSPRLIYCNLGAFGKDGPLADQPGYDPLMQAFGGMMSVTGEHEREPVRVGVPVVDLGTGMWMAIGILAALRDRDNNSKNGKEGKGGVVDVSLLETTLTWMGLRFAAFGATGRMAKRAGSGVRGAAPNRAFLCSDGRLMVSALNNKLFGGLAQVLGHPEWCDDERFCNTQARGRNQDAINQLVEEGLMTQPRAHWIPLLNKAGVPCAPIQEIDEVLAHPQVAALDIIQKFGDGDLPLVRMPVRFDNQRPELLTNPPHIGEHNKKYRADKN